MWLERMDLVPHALRQDERIARLKNDDGTAHPLTCARPAGGECSGWKVEIDAGERVERVECWEGVEIGATPRRTEPEALGAVQLHEDIMMAVVMGGRQRVAS